MALPHLVHMIVVKSYSNTLPSCFLVLVTLSPTPFCYLDISGHNLLYTFPILLLLQYLHGLLSHFKQVSAQTLPVLVS